MRGCRRLAGPQNPRPRVGSWKERESHLGQLGRHHARPHYQEAFQNPPQQLALKYQGTGFPAVRHRLSAQCPGNAAVLRGWRARPGGPALAGRAAVSPRSGRSLRLVVRGVCSANTVRPTALTKQTSKV